MEIVYLLFPFFFSLANEFIASNLKECKLRKHVSWEEKHFEPMT